MTTNDIIAGGACTFSKRYDQFIQGVYSRYWDETIENTFIDTVNALGANTYGRKGMYSLPSKTEIKCAKILCTITDTEMARFFCNGGDATEAATRYARAYNNKEEIWYSGYHGSGPLWTSATPPAVGCIDSKFRKFDSIESIIDSLSILSKSHNISAVVVEPVELDTERSDILNELLRLCNHMGICTIFDEVITGGRVPEFCICNWKKLKPDMITFGKALGGGYPFSTLVGSRKYMGNEKVFASYTFAGFEPALNECIRICSIPHDKIYKFWVKCRKFRDKFNTIGKGIVLLRGYPTRGTWHGKYSDINIFMQEMYKRNVFIGKVWFPAFKWKDSVYTKILEQSAIVIEGMKKCKFKLEGEPPVQLFKRV